MEKEREKEGRKEGKGEGKRGKMRSKEREEFEEKRSWTLYLSWLLTERRIWPILTLAAVPCALP